MADPLFRRIADDLRRQIEDGALPPESQLRTETKLGEQYGASRNTVRDAIKLLITRGLVETRPGQGTFVLKGIVPFVTTLTGDPETNNNEGATYLEEVEAVLRRADLSDPRIEIEESGSKAVPELKLAEGELAVGRRQERHIDDTPWSLQTSFYPMSFVEQGASRLMKRSDIAEGTVEYIKTEIGVKQAGWHDTIIIRTPDEDEAKFFKLPDDGRVSVVEIRRAAFDEQGQPIRLTVSVYPADRNQFAVDVGRVPEEIAKPHSAAAKKAQVPSKKAPDDAEPAPGS